MSAAIRSKIRRIGASDGFDNVTNYPDATLDEWIADALLTVPTARLGAKADLAVAYYTCHLMYRSSSSASSSSSGGIKREKSGDVEIEYHAAGASASVSASGSSYLDEYNRLTKTLLRAGPFVLNGRTP